MTPRQMKVYPRASIDLSRRVRQLAHMIIGSIAGLVGKRIAPHLSKVVGAWLAGLYDNDRPVHRSALESFTKVFSTEEKRRNVWKIYQSSILDFVDDVLLHQTPLTLSDERTVKRDDAESKYARVVGAAILLFNRIIGMVKIPWKRHRPQLILASSKVIQPKRTCKKIRQRLRPFWEASHFGPFAITRTLLCAALFTRC